MKRSSVRALGPAHLLAAWIVLLLVLAGSVVSASAATGRIVKVLPQFLDDKGRSSLSPSLYERDAYQAVLRLHPEKRAGLRFNVQWKTKGPAWEHVTLRLQLRGTAVRQLPKELVLDQQVATTGHASHWTGITLTPAQYKELGAVTAWRATLWEGKQMLGEQKSFLW